MHLGLAIFSTDTSIQPIPLGKAAEEHGFDSLWLPEHSHIPVSRKTPFVGRSDAPPLPEWYWRAHDQFVALSAIAAVTSRLRVGAGISLVAQRDPLWLAKQVASLDLISEGRMLFGIGYGWNREEMADHGVRYEERRDMVREKVLAMKALWTQEVAQFDGRFVRFEPSWAWPKPVQDPHPPVILGGGAGPKNVAHIVEFCDGWMPSYTYNDVLAGKEVIERAAEAAGRDPASIRVGVSGAPTDPAKLIELRDAGVEWAVLPLPSQPPDVVLPLIERYSALIDEVVD